MAIEEGRFRFRGSVVYLSSKEALLMNSKYSLISADSHVVEPASVFVDYIDPKFRDRAPKIIRDSKGLDTFYSEGKSYGSPGLMCGAGRSDTGRTMADVYPGSYDPHARLKEIAADGID